MDGQTDVLFRTDKSFHLDDLFLLEVFFLCLLMFRARSICNGFSVVVLKPGPGSLLGNVLRALGPGSGIALTQQEHIRCVDARRLLFDPAI